MVTLRQLSGLLDQLSAETLCRIGCLGLLLGLTVQALPSERLPACRKARLLIKKEEVAAVQE